MSDDEAKRPVTLGRDELYAQVWATPMRQLALGYGISGNGLAKVCRRLDVPCPPRGYWARKAAGKTVKQTPLPAARPGKLAQATIRPTLPAPPPARLSPELKEALVAARRLTAGLNVPERLLRPHPIVAGWINERRARREDARRWHGGGPLPADFTSIERRRHRILSALFAALERHGYVAKLDDRGRTLLDMDGERVSITLKEKYRQLRRPLTEEEKRQGFNPKRPWKSETQATGLLQLAVETMLGPALPHSWIDASEQPLERQLPDIAAVFVAAAPLLRERRRQYLEAEKRRRDEELRRYEERQNALRDKNRLRGLLELAERAKEAQTAREFLNALVAQAGDIAIMVGDRTLGDWIAWAQDRLAAHDPLQAGTEAVFRTVAAVDRWTYREDWRAD